MPGGRRLVHWLAWVARACARARCCCSLCVRACVSVCVCVCVGCISTSSRLQCARRWFISAFVQRVISGPAHFLFAARGGDGDYDGDISDDESMDQTLDTGVTSMTADPRCMPGRSGRQMGRGGHRTARRNVRDYRREVSGASCYSLLFLPFSFFFFLGWWWWGVGGRRRLQVMTEIADDKRQRRLRVGLGGGEGMTDVCWRRMSHCWVDGAE